MSLQTRFVGLSDLADFSMVLGRAFSFAWPLLKWFGCELTLALAQIVPAHRFTLVEAVLVENAEAVHRPSNGMCYTSRAVWLRWLTSADRQVVSTLADLGVSVEWARCDRAPSLFHASHIGLVASRCPFDLALYSHDLLDLRPCTVTHQNVRKLVLLPWIVALACCEVVVEFLNILRYPVFGHDSASVPTLLKSPVESRLFSHFLTLSFIVFRHTSGVYALLPHVLDFNLVCCLHLRVGMGSSARAVNDWNTEFGGLSRGDDLWRRCDFGSCVQMNLHIVLWLLRVVGLVGLMSVPMVINHLALHLLLQAGVYLHLLVHYGQDLLSLCRDILLSARASMSLTAFPFARGHLLELSFSQLFSVCQEGLEILFCDFHASVHVVFGVQSRKVTSVDP